MYASSRYIYLLVICALLALIPSVTAAPCGCLAEYDWTFDFSSAQTWVTVRVTIHPDPSIPAFQNGWRMHMSSANMVDQVQAYTADTNQTLNFRLEKSQTEGDLVVLFGGSKPDGFTFYAKWLDREIPRVANDQLEAVWDWGRLHPGVHSHTYHLWLPKGYSLVTLSSSPTSSPKTAMQDGRPYVTFSGVVPAQSPFSWRLAAKQEGSQAALGGLVPMSTLQQMLGAAGTGASVVLGWFFKTRKRRFLSGYLTKVDSTYNEYAVNKEECKSRLVGMREEVVRLLNKGKLDETHYQILEGKITQYLQTLSTPTKSDP